MWPIATDGVSLYADDMLCAHFIAVYFVLFVIFSAAVNATVMYISTDYVFDGTSAPYNENDQTNPLNAYGLSKLEGEKIALSVNSSEFSCLLCNIKKVLCFC